MPMQVESLDLRTIYNSRVNPTVEAVINGSRAAAPSGASTGTHEAHCFVPDDLSSIEQELQEALVGEDLTQEEFDARLQAVDGTSLFERIGAVAIASSLAFRKAAGFERPDTFPIPLGNLVGGGAHGGNTTIQEFLVIPHDARDVSEAVAMLSDAYHRFKERYGRHIRGINDEGAYVTTMDDEETLKAVKAVADDVGAAVGIDAAATEYFEAGTYTYDSMNVELPPKQQRKMMATYIDRFDLVYVEDPFHEEAYDDFAALRRDTDTLIVGDDIFVTQEERLQRGIDEEAGNGIIIKPNQVGTVTGARETLELARQNGFTPVVSHRSGETCDPVLSDLALAWKAPLLKAGIAGIRTAKNNQLLRKWHVDAAIADIPV